MTVELILVYSQLQSDFCLVTPPIKVSGDYAALPIAIDRMFYLILLQLIQVLAFPLLIQVS